MRKRENFGETVTPLMVCFNAVISISDAEKTLELARLQLTSLKSLVNERVIAYGIGRFLAQSVMVINRIVCLLEDLRIAQIDILAPKTNELCCSFECASETILYSSLVLIVYVGIESYLFCLCENVRIAAVFETIMDMMPSANKTKISADTLKDVYIGKMVKVSGDDDRWSLFSLHNDFGRCIELKFVDKMRRQFEFSVDSFQITLDPLLDDFNATNVKVYIESMFGDVHQAMSHLHERLIDTRRPEEIRGGGLLKYCHLLTRGYKAARPSKCRQLERYMCSRFFIDFPDVVSQEQKLRNYLDNHFGWNNDQWSSSGDDTDSEASTSQAPSTILAQSQAKYDFLMLLHRVVSESTVCLMSHERRQTLVMIDRLAFQVSLIHSTSALLMNTVAGHTPRTTLFYLPRNTTQWIPVV
ncbi:unnamed protein product [Cylicocyclus nassatus]|uniref:polynucleotide adenylyltransferase n=1 Tax=Cylicocyclus nassatus TaxID=53992 RepID=A0AA36DTL2_CYLNA|nr:unnamed protein product [Cylicocyclus nassatus]